MCSMPDPRFSRRSLLAAVGALGVTKGVHAQTPVASPTALGRIPRLRIGMASAPDAISPAAATTMDSMWLSTLVYDAPIRWNADGVVMPGIFSTTASSKSSEVQLQPRSNAWFSDGTAISARQGVRALSAIKNSRHAWRLENVEEITELENGVLQISMKRADLSLMGNLAHPLFGIDFEGFGSGPFALSFSDGEVATYHRHPLFWQIGRPHIDELVVTRMEDDIQRSTAIATGEIDVLPNVPLLDVPMLVNEPTVYLVGGPSNRLCHLQIRLSVPVLANPRVRQILSSAIDRTGLVSVATANQADPATTLFADGEWTDPIDSLESISPENVRAELHALGVPSDLRLHLLADNADATLANTAVVLQEQLANCGISLSITLLEGEELAQGIAEGDYDLLVSYSEPWRDPHELVWPLLSSLGTLNWSGFQSVEVDTLLKAAISIPSDEFRRERYTRLEGLVRRNVPCIPLFRPYVWDAVSSRFPGYAALPSATSRGLMTLIPTEAP